MDERRRKNKEESVGDERLRVIARARPSFREETNEKENTSEGYSASLVRNFRDDYTQSRPILVSKLFRPGKQPCVVNIFLFSIFIGSPSSTSLLSTSLKILAYTELNELS